MMRSMHNTKTRTRTRILLLAAAAGTLAVGASSVASATTEPPPDVSAAPGAGGSAEASSPEAEAFCTAELAVEAAFGSEDPTLIEPAVGALTAATPAELQETVDAVLAAEEDSPEFDDAYGAMVDWMRDNCGYAELNLTGSEYTFGGLPPEVSAGPTILALSNTGEEVHEALLLRVNDGVELTLDELIALPEEESMTNLTFTGHAFAFPGEIGQAVVDLPPGRYVAVCFLPENADPDIFMQMTGPDSSAPPDANFGPPHAILGMAQEFVVA